MRAHAGHSVKARAGDVVRFHIDKPSNAINVDLGLFSAVQGFDPSPHVARHAATYVNDGKPRFTTPKMLRLHEHRPSGEIEVQVDEKCTFWIMQDIDRRTDPLANVKVLKNGKKYPNVAKRIFCKIRWYLRKRQR